MGLLLSFSTCLPLNGSLLTPAVILCNIYIKTLASFNLKKGYIFAILIGMKQLLFAVAVLLPVFALAQGKDLGAYKQPIPITDNGDLRWLDAALYSSGFIFNDDVREAYFDHCLNLITPHLKFSEKTWEWLNEHPAVLNATFALEYPPNPNVVHYLFHLQLPARAA